MSCYPSSPAAGARPRSILLWILSTGFTLAQGPNSPEPVSRENLKSSSVLHNFVWTYHDSSAEPSLEKPVRQIEHWESRRLEILERFQRLTGLLPSQIGWGSPTLQIEEEIDMGTYVRRKIFYSSEPQSKVPAYLLIPKSALELHQPVSAVLCLHPTDDVLGHKVVVGLGGKENRNYAEELAERGFVTLAPAYPLLANYQPDWRALGYQSGTMKAIVDNMRALDLLSTLPFVATNAFGAIGHSLGGHNAVFTAVFDPRIRVIITSCGLDSFQDYKEGDIRGWTSDRYMPRLLDYRNRLDELPIDFHEITAALAPRPCLLIAPYGDTNFKWQSVDLVVAAARKIYDLYGAGDQLMVEHPDCGHDFPPDQRERAYRLLESVLK